MSALTPEEWAAACQQGDRLKRLRAAYTRARRSLKADEENPAPWAVGKEERSRDERDAAARKIRKALSEAKP